MSPLPPVFEAAAGIPETRAIRRAEALAESETATSGSAAATGAQDVATLELKKKEPTLHEKSVLDMASLVQTARLYPSTASAAYYQADRLSHQDGFEPHQLTAILEAKEEMQRQLALQNFQQSLTQNRRLGTAFAAPAAGVDLAADVMPQPQPRPVVPHPVAPSPFTAPSPFGGAY